MAQGFIELSSFSADVILAVLISRVPEQASYDLCMSTVLFRATSCQTMLLVLHLILMLRVFALYNQSLSVGAFLSALIVTGFVGSTGGVIHGFLHANIEFEGRCVPRFSKGRRENPMVILAVVRSAHSPRIDLETHCDRSSSIKRASPFQPQLFSVLNADALKVFAGIFVGLVAIGVFIYTKGLGTQPALFVFPLLITFISVSGTRTILNLQTLSAFPYEATTSSRKEMELTTVGDMTDWDAPWDTSTFVNVD
ncbi:hypothetical protein D9757_013535 [Collybiopsis confluens]|uniref:Uncharacterized protein n=1 Tax=Collybiopsis confluens TaxID=2823264 RepID=A0A8H5FVN7_9AGAR|nr:hypothetical protein D9757_013535 [Collybiopsis confluens]